MQKIGRSLRSVALAGGTSLIALFSASQAFGQQTAADAPAASQPESAMSEEAATLEEIVVTAQRVSQNLQDVPIAVSTLNGDVAERAGISGTDNLQVAVPSLKFGRQSGNGGAPFLRGVGTNASITGTEQPVAIYVDDVYLGSAQASIFKFNNIAQVEVLKGPQGTLFGRNATGGLIHVRTKRPSFTPEFEARGSYGRFQTWEGAVYATGGISETLAVNFAASGHKQVEGYNRNINSGQDVGSSWDYGFRGGLLWTPGPSTKVFVSADYSRTWSDEALVTRPRPGTVSAGGASYAGRRNVVGTPGAYVRFDYSGISARLDQDLGIGNFVSISAYRRTKQRALFDQDHAAPTISHADVTGDTKNFSQEFQLTSKGDSRLHWIVGAFYFHSDAALEPLRLLGTSQAANGGFVDTIARQILNSYAAFAEGRYEVLPDTNLTLGARYTKDYYKLRSGGRINARGTYLVLPFNTDTSFAKLTYRAILDHHFNDDVMAYASYSRGFKSGGYNLGAPGGPPVGAPPVAPEVLDAFEVGLKSELFDRRLRFNVAAFHYDYSNLQTNVVVAGSALLVNAAAAKIKGIDFDARAVVSNRLSFTLSGAYVDGEYSDFPNGLLYVPNPAVCTPVPRTTGPLTGGNRTCPTDNSGKSIIRTPKFSGSVGATYTLPTSSGDFSATGTLYHSGKYYWDPDNRTSSKAYQLLNLTLSWTAPSERFEVSLWGTNILNTHYELWAQESAQGDIVTDAAPRTVGVAVKARF